MPHNFLHLCCCVLRSTTILPKDVGQCHLVYKAHSTYVLTVGTVVWFTHRLLLQWARAVPRNRDADAETGIGYLD